MPRRDEVGAVDQLAVFERRKPTVGDERRRAILKALGALLRQRPLGAINVADIARAAGMGRSGFYFYFANKGAAVAAMLGDVFDEMLAGSVEAWRTADGPEAAVRAGLERTWQSWSEHQSLILAMLDARSVDPAIGEVWEQWIDGFIDPLSTEVDARRDAERRPASPPAPELVAALLGANERAFERLSRRGAEPDQIEQCLDALTYLWLTTVTRSDT